MTNPLKSACAAIVAALISGACSSGGSDAGSADEPRPQPANQPPTISGTPAQSVTQGEYYEFTPVASDPNGDTLTFSIVNEPLWATFDPATGTLAGTPSDVHIGTTNGILISVSDGALSASLNAFDIRVVGILLGSATVSWDIPSTNADGSPMDDLAGFEVHYGTEAGNYSQFVLIRDPLAQGADIDGLAPDTWYFAVRAFDETGNRSAFSDEVMKEVQP